jgi:hypothetical protein
MFVSGFLPLYDAGILSREVDGAVLHGAFFVDDRAFYERLRAMPKAERQRFRMMAVSFTNELFGDEEGKRAARVGARFINSAMKATLRGAIVSDAVEGGGVVSGVGGQYNFVAQAFALAGARSVMTLNATRQSRGQTVSNIVWAYGHETIPWHLRDIVVTEYGVADLRGKSEVETIAAMLAIADSRFQPRLLAQAKKAGKIPQGYQIPEEQRRNTPKRMEAVLRPLTGKGLLPRFPFGTDFTPEEQRLMPALELLKQKGRTRTGIGSLLMKGLLAGKPTAEQAVCLERMGLHQPRNLKEHLLSAAPARGADGDERVAGTPIPTRVARGRSSRMPAPPRRRLSVRCTNRSSVRGDAWLVDQLEHSPTQVVIPVHEARDVVVVFPRDTGGLQSLERLLVRLVRSRARGAATRDLFDLREGIREIVQALVGVQVGHVTQPRRIRWITEIDGRIRRRDQSWAACVLTNGRIACPGRIRKLRCSQAWQAHRGRKDE